MREKQLQNQIVQIRDIPFFVILHNFVPTL